MTVARLFACISVVYMQHTTCGHEAVCPDVGPYLWCMVSACVWQQHLLVWYANGG
jgi:hypothetical protein